MKCWIAALSAAASALSTTLPVQAQVPAQSAGWSFTIAPYAWLMSINGTATAAGQKVDVNANFIDNLGKTDTMVGLMAYGEGRTGPYGVYFDFIYSQVAASGGFATERNPLPNVTRAASPTGDVRSTLMIIEAGAMYELYRSDRGDGAGSSIDAILGIRYWHANTDLSVNVNNSFNAPGSQFDRAGSLAAFHSGSMDWVDPLVGLRLRQRIAPHHELRLRGDIGGFGIGSQLTWQLLLTYGYEFSSGSMSWSAVIGYRALGVNYVKSSGADGSGIDVVLHGPILGVAMKF